MKSKKIIQILFTFSLAIILPGCPAFTGVLGTVDRQTQEGIVTGEHYSHNNYESFRFRGIPYAQPPVGDLRFRPPHDPTPYPGGRLEAFDYPKFCFEGGATTPDPAGNEDCLYLNVWTPADATPGSDKPVMFWIHGGGNATGKTSDELWDFLDLITPPELEQSLLGFLTALGFTIEDGEVYDGHYLAGGQDVVVVTIEYRLGPMGHLAHPSLGEGSGNFSFLDIHKALGWVQNNITNFGGDKDNITVFGESAGAWDTCALMNMPAAKGMFHKAIMQSMACISKTPEQAEELGDFYIQRTGCQNAPDIAACLREVDAGAFYDMDADVLSNEERGAFIPVIDGNIFPEWFGDAVQTESFSHVPLIIGNVKDEFFIPVLSDGIFNCPIDKNLEIFDAHLDAPLYRYRFDHHAYGPWFPTFHASELPYTFGTVADLYKNSAREVDVAKTKIAYWTNFARTGNPNGPGLVHWPEYDRSSEAFLGLKGQPEVKNGSIIQSNCDTSHTEMKKFLGDQILFW